MSYRDYMLNDKLPHTWCAGCGNGIVLQAIAAAFDGMKLDKHEIALASGIGCFGRVDDYLDINCMHVTHGRALPAATGIALANPGLKVICTMGDGDGVTIGGNHLIHAARRNINVTAIMANNYNYGQTGGQYSATTPTHSITPTSPYGHVENCFDVCELVAAAGASFVARATASNPVELRRLIRKGIENPGFSFIECMVVCPTHYGRYNRWGTAAGMMKRLDAGCVPAAKAKRLPAEELKGKLVTGVIANRPRPDYYTLYKEIIDRAEAEG